MPARALEPAPLSPAEPSTTGSWVLRERPSAIWIDRCAAETPDAAFAAEAGLSPLLARVFHSRGFRTPSAVQDFLRPSLAGTHDPFLLKDMDRAVDRLAAAIAAGEPIVIYGDYDVDGITATAIMKSALDFLGVAARAYIPHRLNEGYGLQADALRQLAADGAKVVVTVDNGTTAHAEIALAQSLGVDVIVTDHHEPDGPLPPACALVNPKQPGCAYPFKELCGAGVAFKLAHALLKRLAPDPAAARAFLMRQLDFVALGTLADVVPLLGENRAIVSHGLSLLRSGSRLGIRSLFDVIGLNPAEVQADRIAYTVAPRINAAGRTEHAEYALELLLATDPAQARELAGMLERFNEERRRIESDITEQAFAMIDESGDDPVLVVEQEGWHLGVIGIVASRLLDRYYRPVIVLGVEGDRAKGSARSVSGFDMHAALSECREHLEQFGGHTMAAGLRLKTDKIGDLRRALNEHARRILSQEDLTPRLTIDARAEPRDLTLDNAQALDAMGPFGPGNPKPLLAIDGLNLVEEPRVLKSRHLKLHLAGPDGASVWAIGFSLGDRAEELRRRCRKLRIAAVPFVNAWGGRQRVELEIRDFIIED